MESPGSVWTNVAYFQPARSPLTPPLPPPKLFLFFFRAFCLLGFGSWFLMEFPTDERQKVLKPTLLFLGSHLFGFCFVFFFFFSLFCRFFGRLAGPRILRPPHVFYPPEGMSFFSRFLKRGTFGTLWRSKFSPISFLDFPFFAGPRSGWYPFDFFCAFSSTIFSPSSALWVTNGASGFFPPSPSQEDRGFFFLAQPGFPQIPPVSRVPHWNGPFFWDNVLHFFRIPKRADLLAAPWTLIPLDSG